MPAGTRVVFVAFDGFPRRTFGPRLTPNMWRLAEQGGFALDGGLAGHPSTTYPGFVSLLTGCSRSISGVRTTNRKKDAVPGWAGSDISLVPTLLHEAAAAGRRVAAVFGDHKLQRVARLDDCAWAWPLQSELDASVAVDAHGYPTNAAILPHALAAAADPDLELTFVDFNETDTLGHDLGPDASETLDCVRAADAAVGSLVETLAPDWVRTLVIVTSDHDMEPIEAGDPIDPRGLPEHARLISDWIADGSAALIRLAMGVEHDQLIEAMRAIDGVIRWRCYDPDMLLLLAAPGRVFAGQRLPAAGTHGSDSTARTLAIVGGGHPAVDALAASIRRNSPRLRDWAPTIGSILGVDLVAADGTDLLAEARGGLLRATAAAARG